MSDAVMVGDWTFTPGLGVLARGADRRRLEHRAAKVLELLCSRAGEPVSAGELVQAVWGGRSLSPNSVAVVIADLRRALDDDSRAPQYIETIPKRGYRLLAPVAEESKAKRATPKPMRRAALAAGIGALALLGGVAWQSQANAPAPLTVSVADFPNATLDARYDALASAVTDLVSTEVGKLPGVRVTRGGAPQARITGRVVLWSGHASVSLSAVDVRTGAVIWAGMAPGPSTSLPRQLHAEIAQLGAEVARRAKD